MANNSTLLLPTTATITSAQLTIIRTFTISTTILGTAGNFLTIFAILKERLYQNPSFLFILNLSVCNFIHCTVLHPLLTLQAFHNIWTDNHALCVTYSYMMFSNLGTELWGYTCITVNRYVCVVHHHVYSRLYGRTRNNVLQLVWAWSFYPALLLFPVAGVWSSFEYAPQKLLCHPFTETNCNGFCLFTYLVALGSSAPVFIFCYLSIIHKYIKSQRKVGLSRDRSVHASLSMEANQQITTKVKRDSDKQRTLSELKMAFTILAVIAVFASCRFPFMVLYMYDPTMTKVRPIIHTTVIYIGSNSNWINPIIYAFTNVQIYNALKKHLSPWRKTLVVQKSIKQGP